MSSNYHFCLPHSLISLCFILPGSVPLALPTGLWKSKCGQRTNHTFEASEIPFHSNPNVTFNRAQGCGFQLLWMRHSSENGPYSLPHWVQLLLADGAASAASSGSRFRNFVPKYPYCRASMDCAELHTSFAAWLFQTGEACLFCWEFLDELENFRSQLLPAKVCQWIFSTAGIWAAFKKEVDYYHAISNSETSSLNASMQKLYYTHMKNLLCIINLNWQLSLVIWEKEHHNFVIWMSTIWLWHVQCVVKYTDEIWCKLRKERCPFS